MVGMFIADAGARWTIVHHNQGDPVVRRYAVPGGHLYQVAQHDITGNDRVDGMPMAWHPPVFVPTKVSG